MKREDTAAVQIVPARRDHGRALVLLIHASAEMYGSDKVLLNLATSLATGHDYRPVVVLPENGPLHEALTRAGVEVHVGAVAKISRSMLNPLAALAVLRLARQALQTLDRVVAGREVTLVHSNTLAVLGGALWARLRGRRHVWHVHEIILKPAAVRHALPWLAHLLSQRVIANSSLTERWLLDTTPRLKGRSVVVFNGLPPLSPADPDAIAAFRRAAGAGPDDILVTVAGRLNHWKGQGLLIDAMARLKREGRLGRLKLAVVGSVFSGHDDVRAQLVAQLAGHGLGGVVRLIDFMQDIDSVWRGTQIAVVPSIEPEPFGMVAIEAMACGVPVVAAAHGGLLDIVVDRVTGLLFTPRSEEALAAAVAELAADAALRDRLGRAGQERQQALFSMSTQLARTQAVYEEMTTG